MQLVKTIEFKQPTDLLGKAIKIFLKDGGAFHFKVTEAGPDWIGGYDDEGLNLRIEAKDIEFIVG